jgi:hypothetical protein
MTLLPLTCLIITSAPPDLFLWIQKQQTSPVLHPLVVADEGATLASEFVGVEIALQQLRHPRERAQDDVVVLAATRTSGLGDLEISPPTYTP